MDTKDTNKKNIAPNKTPAIKTKSTTKKGLGLWKTMLMIIVALLLFFFTPLFGFLISFIPNTLVRDLISPYYQDVILDESRKQLSEPLKYDTGAPYDVLGRDSGVCFKFYSTRKNENKSQIDKYRLNRAAKGKPIAEIIITDLQKKQYTLKETSLLEDTEYNEEKNTQEHFSIICQRIGRTHPILPSTITAIYIRPLAPFTPNKVIWATRKEFY